MSGVRDTASDDYLSQDDLFVAYHAASKAGFAYVCLHCGAGLDANRQGQHAAGCTAVSTSGGPMSDERLAEIRLCAGRDERMSGPVWYVRAIAELLREVDLLREERDYAWDEDIFAKASSAVAWKLRYEAATDEHRQALSKLEHRAWAIFNHDGTLDHVEIAKLRAHLVDVAARAALEAQR